MVREHTSFESCIGKLGTFPTLLNPKVIWMGIRKNEDKINKLQQAIEEIMEPLGLKKEIRAFSPHLTLGRVRSKKNIQKLTEKLKTLSLPHLIPFTVYETIFFQSILKPSGAEYTVLDKFSLKVES
ncbi:MAG: RNA 2',3'-cyclic phosphodiesterase [Candidatus Omnitrophica bacterium]|nr:RNA 2',3'-cyclic phosphodiesterase [Candidatus Omnitrophota bacterium]